MFAWRDGFDSRGFGRTWMRLVLVGIVRPLAVLGIPPLAYRAT